MALTSPTLTLLTEQEFRASRYKDLADNVDRLADILAEAEAIIQTAVDRTLARATHVETFVSPKTVLFTHQYPIVAVASLQVRQTDGTVFTLDPFSYQAHPELPIVDLASSHVGETLVLTYDAGYSPIPHDIKAAMILQSVLLMYTDFEVYGAGDGKTPGIVYMKKDIADMIKPYRRIGVGG